MACLKLFKMFAQYQFQERSDGYLINIRQVSPVNGLKAIVIPILRAED